MNFKKLADNMSFVMGALALALILGALGFQYIGRYEPCEICHYQRWPLFAAIFVGFVGGAVSRNMSPSVRKAVTTLTILLVALSGGIGVWHAGIEWGWWPGPTHCTGQRFIIGAPIDPNAYRVVQCDKPAWLDPVFNFFSLAALNAIFSLSTAIVAALIVRKAEKV